MKRLNQPNLVNQPKHNTKLFHNYKENIWLKNMQLIETKRCFVFFQKRGKRVF